MGVPLKQILARLPADERAAIEARTAELVAQEMSLRDLRKALGKTQVTMAGRLGIKQENVSRIEHRSDMLLSTLDSYLQGMGGKLRLVAEFPGRPPVEIKGLAEVGEPLVPNKSKRATGRGTLTRFAARRVGPLRGPTPQAGEVSRRHRIVLAATARRER